MEIEQMGIICKLQIADDAHLFVLNPPLKKEVAGNPDGGFEFRKSLGSLPPLKKEVPSRRGGGF